MASQDKSKLSDRQIAELTALADGTLPRERRAGVEEAIARAPALAAVYDRERRVVELLHEARARDRAPAALRARVEARRPTRRTATRRQFRYGAYAVGALAAIALALALLLPAGTPGSPTVSQAAALAARGPTRPAPRPNRHSPLTELATRVQGIVFPNWSRALGWRAIGVRRDVLDHRPAVTVYYRWHEETVAYTIVGAPALPKPAARVTHLRRHTLRTLTINGRVVVTWRRKKNTCVLSAVGVSPAEMQVLAAWDYSPRA